MKTNLEKAKEILIINSENAEEFYKKDKVVDYKIAMEMVELAAKSDWHLVENNDMKTNLEKAKEFLNEYSFINSTSSISVTIDTALECVDLFSKPDWHLVENNDFPYANLTFYSCKEKLPEFIGLNFTVKPIYFTVNKTLYRGEYHVNGWFYAYQSCGDIEIMAIGNKQNFKKGISHKKEHEIYAEYWAYSN